MPAKLLTNPLKRNDDGSICYGDNFTVQRMTMTRSWTRHPTRAQIYPKKSALPGIDIVMRSEPGLITPETKVAAVGSCFANHICQWLKNNGYIFLRAEDGPRAITQNSGRFGPVFSTGCLRQIFEFAYGRFNPQELYWERKEGLEDPYRHFVGWPDAASAENEREAHKHAVRLLVEHCDVMILTIGLGETWRNKRTGVWYHNYPPGDCHNPDEHELYVTTVEENVENLSTIRSIILEHNPAARIILTVSPIPMALTFGKQHAIVADSVSKAILRVAADLFCRANPDVIYFPAFEIVRELSIDPYEDDNRHVKPEIIAGVMETFIQHYGQPEGASSPSESSVTNA